MTKGASPRRRRHPRHRSRQPSYPAHPAHPVILRAVAGSTRADNAASGMDSATTRGMDKTAGRCRSSITRRNACAPTRDSRQTRWQVSRLAAGSVAASKARRCPDQTKRWRKYFCPNRLGEPAVRRACTWGDAAPGHRGHFWRAYEVAERGHHRVARTNLDRTPSESGRPGRIQGARAESSQVHASRAAARAADPREAHHASSTPREPG